MAFNAPVNGARSDRKQLHPGRRLRYRSERPRDFGDPPDGNGGGISDSDLARPGRVRAVGRRGDRCRHQARQLRSFMATRSSFFATKPPTPADSSKCPALPRGVFRQNQYGATLSGPIAPSTYFFASYRGPAQPLRGGDAASGAGCGRSRRRFLRRPDHLRSIHAHVGGHAIAVSEQHDSRQPHRSRRPRNIWPLYEPLPNAVARQWIELRGFDAQSRPLRQRLHAAGSRLGSSAAVCSFATPSTTSVPIWPDRFPRCPPSRTRAPNRPPSDTRSRGASWVNEAHFSFTRLRVFDLPESAFGTNVLANLGITRPVHQSIHLRSARPHRHRLRDRAGFRRIFRKCSATTPGISPTDSREPADATPGRPGFSSRTSPWPICRACSCVGISSSTARTRTIRPIRTTPATRSPIFCWAIPAQTQRAVGNAQAYLRHNNYAAYIQDDWRLTPRITISAGLRYEYFAPFTEDRGNLLEPGLLDAARRAGVAACVPAASIPTIRISLPRIGLAARLPRIFGEFARHRVSRRLWHLLQPRASHRDLRSAAQWRAQPVQPARRTRCRCSPSRTDFRKPAPPDFPATSASIKNAPTPYVQQWSASIQHELPGDTLFEIAYVGTKGTDLGRFRRFNTPAHVEIGQDLPPRPGDLQSLRTFPELGTIFQDQHIGQLHLSFAADQGREAIHASALIHREFRVGEIH